GNGKRAFGLTEIEDTGVNSEEEQAEVEGGQGTHQAFPAVPLPPSYLDDTLDALAKTMDLPPNHGGSIGSLSNGTFQTTTTSAVVQKPPRKVGPRPWFTHGGKSKMLVSSKSMGSIGIGNVLGTGQPFTMARSTTSASLVGVGKMMLNDGLDDDGSILGSRRARAHSASRNRWNGHARSRVSSFEDPLPHQKPMTPSSRLLGQDSMVEGSADAASAPKGRPEQPQLPGSRQRVPVGQREVTLGAWSEREEHSKEEESLMFRRAGRSAGGKGRRRKGTPQQQQRPGTQEKKTRLMERLERRSTKGIAGINAGGGGGT
ncbi:hypothetical protein TrRE_jg9049, partial [Triparma retinervis]